MSFSLLVTLLTYWIYVNIGISPVLDIYFWNFWTYSQDISEIYPDYLNSYMSVSLSLHLLYLFQFVISGGQLLRPLVLLFWVCKYNFHPLVSKIASKENYIADFWSRNYLQEDIDLFFARENFPPQNKLIFSETDFTLIADW